MGNQLSTSNTLALNPPGPPDRLSVSQHGSSTGLTNRGDWTTVKTKGSKTKMKQDLVKQDQVMQGLVIHDSVTHDSVMQDQKKQDQVNWRGSASSSKDELCTKVPKWCIANTSCSKFIGNAIHGGLYAFTFSKVKNWFSSCRLESKVESKTKKVKQRKFNHKGNLINDKPYQWAKKNRTMKNWSKVRKENKNRPKNKAKSTKNPQNWRNK